MESTTTKIDEGSLEKQPEPEVSTILNPEINNSEMDSQIPDVEMKNLNINNSRKQQKLDKYLEGSGKRQATFEIETPKFKIQKNSKAITKIPKKVSFPKPAKNLFADNKVALGEFRGESNKTLDQTQTSVVAVDSNKTPEQTQTPAVSVGNNETPEQTPAVSVGNNETPEQTPAVSVGNNKTSQQKIKPPPIHITTGSAGEIRNMAKEINNQPRSIVIDMKKNNARTKVVTMDNWNDYNKFIEVLKSKQHHFHTYSSEEPQLKYVMYGLPTMELVEVEKELLAENITPAKIAKMTMRQKRHENDDDQNYLLYFKKESGQNGDFLDSLRKVKIVGGFKIRFAVYKNKQKGPSQCSKCLQFGHGQRGCNNPHTCFRCSEQHDSKNCPYISIETNKVPVDKLKCHFCGEKHTAISPVCKVKLQIIEKWKNKSTNGNNRHQNKPGGHRQQFQTGQWRNASINQYKWVANNNLQRSENGQGSSTTPVKPTQQNNIKASNQKKADDQKPGAHQNSGAKNNQTNRNKNKKRRRRNKRRTNNQGNNNQQQPLLQNNKKCSNQKPGDQQKPVFNQKPAVEEIEQPDDEMEIETEVLPTSQNNKELVVEQSTSCSTPAQTSDADDEIVAESIIAKCLDFVKEIKKLLEVMKPKYRTQVQEAIGSIAKFTTN
jgi:hypothetical protein